MALIPFDMPQPAFLRRGFFDSTKRTLGRATNVLRPTTFKHYLIYLFSDFPGAGGRAAAAS
jgi:hypothetical protein